MYYYVYLDTINILHLYNLLTINMSPCSTPLSTIAKYVQCIIIGGFTSIYIYIYIYICVCMCVCVCVHHRYKASFLYIDDVHIWWYQPLIGERWCWRDGVPPSYPFLCMGHGGQVSVRTKLNGSVGALVGLLRMMYTSLGMVLARLSV